jgi:hypothetical protein
MINNEDESKNFPKFLPPFDRAFDERTVAPLSTGDAYAIAGEVVD